MDDRRALMAAIIGNPDEDTPRLALADWLQEHGDKHEQARAEFIRLQIEIAAGGRDADAASNRTSELEKAHAKHWLGPLWELCPSKSSREFTRGITGSFISAGSFLKKANQAACVEQFPLLGIDRLVLHGNTRRRTPRRGIGPLRRLLVNYFVKLYV